MKKIFLLTAILSHFISEAQINESFMDGNFTFNPVWTGTNTEWTIVVSSDVAAGAANSNTLRVNNASVAATDYLSTQVLGSWGTLGQTWIFWFGRRAQAATDANRSYFWLYASETDVTSPTVDGYRVRFGDDGGNDEIYIESVTNGVASTVLISSGAVLNGLTDIGFLVRVNRTSAGVFTLYTSILPTVNGTGEVATVPPTVSNTGVFQGSATNNDHTDLTNGYISIASTHTSSATARTGAEFDQIRMAFIANAPLPVKLGGIKAYEKQEGIQIDWTSYSEDNVLRYEIERSSDGSNFNSIGTVDAMNSNSMNHYNFIDTDPLRGNNFYRLRSIDADGQYSYSVILKVNVNGIYTIRIFNLGGQQVYAETVTQIRKIDLPSVLSRGIYCMQIWSGATRMISKLIAR